MAKLDLTGEIFNRLRVIKELPSKGFHRYWECECSCGAHTHVAQSNLRTKKTQSCGCLQKEKATETYAAKFTKHGDYKTRLYGIYVSMRDRCTKEWDSNYSRYGAIGIKVSNSWDTYPKFKEWANTAGYTENLTLDRKNGNLGYSPENCRWVTYEAQTRNRRKQSKPASSIYIGVTFDKQTQNWRADINVCKKHITIGKYSSEVLAAQARDAYIKENNLEYFKLNF